MVFKSSLDSLFIFTLVIIITGLQTFSPLVPLHRAIGQPHDSAMMITWRVLVWTCVYAPTFTPLSQKPLVTAMIVVSSTFLGQNTFPILLTDRPLWLDVIWAGFLILWSVELFQMMRPLQLWSQIAFISVWFLVGFVLFIEDTFYGYASVLQTVQFIMLCVIHIRIVDYTFYPNSRLLWRVLTIWILLPCAALLISTPLQYWAGMSGIRNFSGNMICNTEGFSAVPVNISELQSMVKRGSVRVAGGLHSWSNYICPVAKGTIVRTTELRSIEMLSNGDVRCGAGVTMGSITTYLKAFHRQLEETWHSDVTLGGAVATGIHHRGEDFMDCCVSSLRLMLGDGEIVEVSPDTQWNGINVWYQIPGSVGLLGIIVELTIKSIPLTTIEYTSKIHSWSDEQELDAQLNAWLASNVRNDTLLIVPMEKKMIISSKARTTVVESDKTDEKLPVYATTTYAIVGFAFDLYAGFWSAAYTFAIGWFMPLNLYGSSQYDFFKERLTVSSLHTETRKMLNRLGTEHATIELDTPVECKQLSKCVHKLSTFKPYTPSLEVRYATQGPYANVAHGECVVHIDFSLPIWLLDAMQQNMADFNHFCPSHFQHNGKANWLQVKHTRLYKAPPLAKMSTSMLSTEFQSLRKYADPYDKFMYAVAP